MMESSFVSAATNVFLHTNKNPEKQLGTSSFFPSRAEIEEIKDNIMPYRDSFGYHPSKLLLQQNQHVSRGEQQQQQQQQQQQKQHTQKELLPIFKELSTKEVSDVIITKKFRQIQQQMRTRGLATDLSFAQISRDVVGTKIVDAVEKAIIKREQKEHQLS